MLRPRLGGVEAVRQDGGPDNSWRPIATASAAGQGRAKRAPRSGVALTGEHDGAPLAAELPPPNEAPCSHCWQGVEHDLTRDGPPKPFGNAIPELRHRALAALIPPPRASLSTWIEATVASPRASPHCPAARRSPPLALPARHRRRDRRPERRAGHPGQAGARRLTTLLTGAIGNFVANERRRSSRWSDRERCPRALTA